MGFTSLYFPLFAGTLLVLYYVLPRRAQWPLLLTASLWFYCGSGANPLWLLLTALTTYTTARLLGRFSGKRGRRLLFTGCLAFNFSMLFFFKFRLLQGFALPLGISFFLFQSAGYLTDVYRGTEKAEKNPLKLLLFLGYFPQLIQGPISKFSQLAPQLTAPHAFSSRELSFGLQRMLWGYFKKLVIADRLAVAVAALRDPDSLGLLALLYGLQIYGDFTGGIDIALGLSQSLGLTLTENFRHPFFSRSVAEYWRRWHISLGAWMREYIFFPVSVSTPARRLSKFARKHLGPFGKRLPVYLATLITWLATGIWHGLQANFLVWGLLNCGIIMLSEELAPVYRRFHRRFRLNTHRWYGAFQALRTFLLMNLIRVCDLFPHVGDYFSRLGRLFSGSRRGLSGLGLTGLDWGIIAVGSLLMLSVSLLEEARGSIRQLLWSRTWLRYFLTFSLLLAVLLLGRYGLGYDAGNFIYNQF